MRWERRPIGAMPGAHIREHLRIVIFFPTDPSTQGFLTILSRLRSEEPLMSLGVFGPVSTLAKRSIPDFLNDLCSSLLCTHEVCVNVGNVDEEALRCMPELSRVLVVRARAAHHHQILS